MLNVHIEQSRRQVTQDTRRACITWKL